MSALSNIIKAFVIVFFIITFIVNNKKIINKFKKVEKLKILILTYIILCILIIILYNFIKGISSLEYYNVDISSTEKMIEESKEKIQISLDNYKKIMKNTSYNIENSKNPYIPDGFEYVEGMWNTGFVIQDEFENQFVWVPCSNEKNEDGIEILQKKDFSNDAFIKSFQSYEEDIDSFLISSIENGGFYIGRYEVSKENDIPVIKSNNTVITDITKKEALDISNKFYNNINSSLINGYAYDTAFSWIYNSEKKLEANVKSVENIISGTKCYKNIYDMVDNIFEFTTEIQYDSNVYRGIIEESKYVDSPEFDNRLVANEDYKSTNLGFRIILYK